MIDLEKSSKNIKNISIHMNTDKRTLKRTQTITYIFKEII